jgi:peptidoglycan/xylan/chitin deacetylase (PgdA/CDA1 family)
MRDRYGDAMQQSGRGERDEVRERDAAGERARRRAAARTRARQHRRAAIAALVLVATPVAVLLAGGSSHRGSRSGGLVATAGARGGARRAPGTPQAAGTGAAEDGDSAQVRSLVALGKPIYCAARRGNEVALTFDDGPGPYTRLMLAKLHKHHVRATFFDVGRNIPLVPGAIREERETGGVGDHTFTHPLLTALAPANAEAEIVRTQAALESAGAGRVFLFRPPYGGRNETIDRIARERGMLEILWTVDSADSLGAEWAQIERNVIAGLRGGAIILMHENHGQTIRAMLGIFAALERKHLRTVSVAQLLTDDPPGAAQVHAGGAACGVRVSALSGG